MFFFVFGCFQEESGYLFKAVLLCLGSKIRVLVSGLGFAGKSSFQVLFGPGSGIRIGFLFVDQPELVAFGVAERAFGFRAVFDFKLLTSIIVVWFLSCYSFLITTEGFSLAALVTRCSTVRLMTRAIPANIST